MSRFSCVPCVFCVVGLLAAGLASPGHAQPVPPVHFIIGEAVGNPGDIVEVPVWVQSEGLAPEVCVLFINFDPLEVEPYAGYYEFVQTDLAGNPVRDGQGNVIATTSAVRPEVSVTSSGKVLDSHVFSDGSISVAVVGLNTIPLPDGLLFTVAFRVKSGLTVDSVLLEGDVINSSAAAREGSGAVVSIPLAWEDGEILLGCQPPPAPTGVGATTNRTDAVVVSWQAVQIPGAEYRVFRSAQANAANAAPLGEGWQTATTFTDITALGPETGLFPGCPRLDKPEPITYFYWVRVRGEDGCMSAFSTPPASGARAAAVARAGMLGGADVSTLALYLTLMLVLALPAWRKQRTEKELSTLR